jgi:hypothetical protein
MFLFPPIAVTLAILNYRRLGDRLGAWKAMALFGLPTLTLVLLGLGAQARGVGVSLRAVALMWAIRAVLAYLVFQDQRPLVRRHFEAGGRKARWALGWIIAFPVFVGLLAVHQVLTPPLEVPHALGTATSEAPAAAK